MTTDELMTLANDYANAETVFEAAQKQQALRLAIEQLVAERDAMRGHLEWAVLERRIDYVARTKSNANYCDRVDAIGAALKGKT